MNTPSPISFEWLDYALLIQTPRGWAWYSVDDLNTVGLRGAWVGAEATLPLLITRLADANPDYHLHFLQNDRNEGEVGVRRGDTVVESIEVYDSEEAYLEECAAMGIPEIERQPWLVLEGIPHPGPMLRPEWPVRTPSPIADCLSPIADPPFPFPRLAPSVSGAPWLMHVPVVSSTHITRADHDRLEALLEQQEDVWDLAAGWLLFIETWEEAENPELSAAFHKLVQHFRGLGYAYLRIAGDGEELPGWETFDW